MRFITEYQRINQGLVGKTYPQPRIGNKTKQPEVFQYATALDINMGYYTISISPAIQGIMTIVTEFGKFKYNCLPTGMCDLGDIFQAKIEDLLGDIEGVKIYINYLLVLIKEFFSKYTKQLRIIFGRLRAAGLKVNDPKCSSGLKEIPYLGYVITREGIK